MVKPWTDLTITDDFMFCKVMSQPDLCKEMIELLLNIKIARIDNIQVQQKDSKLGIFLNYLNTSLANDEYTSKIEEAVRKAIL